MKGITERQKQRQIRERQKRTEMVFTSHWRSIKNDWIKSDRYKEWAKKEHVRKGIQRDKDNPEKARERKKRWREKNPEKAREWLRKWERENPEKKRENRKKSRDRRKKDPLVIAQKRVRGRTLDAFKRKRWNKKSGTRELLGCSREMLVSHIESKFAKGMSWDNRDKWHIDHIVPLSSANSIEELERLAHFSNLRPMWAIENMAKGDKIIDCQPELSLVY